ncbi:putative mitochondrial hypothetical protein [Leptomonas pyrrhocoris]|uniref:Transmembrane protein n=1 Tax=Leptomonas pyrrhocoris TaxID=157538 RepID=A0A0N1J4A2_LEPPY|nr:putative mitochondrial hypothetical protein [Leptomonas pyrrhocoris]XP_015653013.1 putative mitochondrial hypothetical protein [Leptomonas pyrrhocoris]KPA74573.1 putative mitochondrial hypothetical protein [Leptomonas pyrrhocoris]KPA74574.1 putative mitochondrial hypothetical protein [Leptomonas pyrrhocoris]|eukprot:XP_015653012.1 putative mitochondrial hypothetical protein [Leptomonas pyrrhocoris]
MRRIARLPSSLVPLVVQARWQSSGDKEAPPATAEAKPPRANSADAAAETPKAMPQSADTSASGGEQGGYHFATNEVLDAVKKRDFNAVQTHASKLVQSQWRESYNVPAACIIIYIVMWYWIAWRRRSIRRKCEAIMASTKQQTEEMVDIVRNMTEKWKCDMAKANQLMQGIIDKNSELTRDIDRMTTALRSCSIRPTAAAAATPFGMAAKRAPVMATEEAPGELKEVTEASLPDRSETSE